MDRSVLLALMVLSVDVTLVFGTVLLLRRSRAGPDAASSSGDGRPPGARRGPPVVPQVYRVIVAVDIERFGRTTWDDEFRVRSTQSMRAAVAEALSSGGIPHGRWSVAAHTGDGLLVTANPDVGTANVLRALLDRLAAGLATRNRLMVADARLRLRVVLHAGHVMLDQENQENVVGTQVNLAFRLLDADSLKHRLRGSPAPAVVAVSQHIYEQVVWQRALDLDPDHFQPLLVNVKETSAPAWVYAPDAMAAGDQLAVPDNLLPEWAS